MEFYRDVESLEEANDALDWEIPLHGETDPKDLLAAFEEFNKVNLFGEARSWFLETAEYFYNENV